MKRFTAGAVVVAVLCSALLACGRDSPPTSPKNLKPPTIRHDGLVWDSEDLYSVETDSLQDWAKCKIATGQDCDPMSESDTQALIDTALLLIYGNDGSPMQGDCVMLGANMLTGVLNGRYYWARWLNQPGVTLYPNPAVEIPGHPFDWISDQIMVLSPSLKGSLWENRFVAVHEAGHFEGLRSFDIEPQVRRVQNESIYTPTVQWLERGCWY